MKDFLMKFDDKGKIAFVDEKDRAAYRLLLSSLKRNGIFKFKMSIDVWKNETISDKQKRLFKVLIDMISKESGNDIQTIEQTLISNFSHTKKDILEFNNEDFNSFLEWIIIFCNDFFNLNVSFNDNGSIEIKKIR